MKNKTCFVLGFVGIVLVILLLLTATISKSARDHTKSQGELYVNNQVVPAALIFVEESGKNYVEIPFLSSLEALGYLVEKENDAVAVWTIDGNVFISDLSFSHGGVFYCKNSQYKSDEIFPALGEDWGYRAVRDGDIYLDHESLRTTFSALGINADLYIDFNHNRVDIIRRNGGAEQNRGWYLVPG